MVIPDHHGVGRVQSRVTQVRYPRSSGAAGTAQPYSVPGALDLGRAHS